MSARQAIVSGIRRHRTALLFVGALGFGAAAVVGMRNHIGEQLAIERERLQPRKEMVRVVVARQDLQRGDAVGPETMAVRELPRDYAPGGAIVPERFDELVGARLAVAMRSGEPLLPGQLDGGEAPGISARLRPGVRALTIAVDEVNSLSGMLQPGDRIDLLLSVRPPHVDGTPQVEVTRTLLQDVPVLATGRQTRPTGDDGSGMRSFTAITVEVDPERAQKLVVAQRSGRLTAVLRNPHDRKPIVDRRIDIHSLLGGVAPTVPPPVEPRMVTEIIVGGRGPLAHPVPEPIAPAVRAAASPGAGPPGSVTASAVAPPAPGADPSPPGPTAALPRLPR